MEDWLLLAVLRSLKENDKIKVLNFWLKAEKKNWGLTVSVKNIFCNSKIDIAKDKTLGLMLWVAEYQISSNSPLCQIL